MKTILAVVVVFSGVVSVSVGQADELPPSVGLRADFKSGAAEKVEKMFKATAAANPKNMVVDLGEGKVGDKNVGLGKFVRTETGLSRCCRRRTTRSCS